MLSAIISLHNEKKRKKKEKKPYIYVEIHSDSKGVIKQAINLYMYRKNEIMEKRYERFDAAIICVCLIELNLTIGIWT